MLNICNDRCFIVAREFLTFLILSSQSIEKRKLTLLSFLFENEIRIDFMILINTQLLYYVSVQVSIVYYT